MAKIKNSVIYAAAQLADIEHIQTVDEEAFGRMSYLSADLHTFFNSPQIIFLVAKLNDRIIGYSIGEEKTSNNTAWIESLAVFSDYKKQGIGQQLLRILLKTLEKKLIKTVYVTLQSSNIAAMTTYKKLGFHPDTEGGNDAVGADNRLVMKKVDN